MLLIIVYLVGAFAYYQIFCNVYVYKREYGSRDWYECGKNKNRLWIWLLAFIGLCIPLFGAICLFLLYLALTLVGIEDDYVKYKIPENFIFKFLNKKI